jgi:hypothetical protein
MSCRTGVPNNVTLGTTLRSYEGVLFKTMRWSGSQQWILALQMHHRKRIGFGLQFCPACLAEDVIPYFRKQWRVAFVTICVRHGIMLLDRCPKCKSPLAFHRLDMLMAKSGEFMRLSYCHECLHNLSDSPRIEPTSYSSSASALLHEAIQALQISNVLGKRWNIERYAVMHQLCRIMITKLNMPVYANSLRRRWGAKMPSRSIWQTYLKRFQLILVITFCNWSLG